MGSPHNSNNENVRLEETLYPQLKQEPESEIEEKQELQLKTTDFKLVGLGEAGKNCGKVVMSDIGIDRENIEIKAVKYKPLRCSRIECPSCYYEWAIKQAFWISLKIEALAEIREERPFHVVFSVHPLQCYGMTWTDINQRVWRRGRRRLSYIRCEKYYEKLNGEGCLDHSVRDCPNCIDLSREQYGATGMFHPFRIKKKWKEKLGGGSGNEELEGNAKLWRKIRGRLLNGLGELEDYVKIGYHCHNVVFTDRPELQRNEEYVIKFTHDFKRISRKEVVALARYFITHTATIKETAIYRNHVCVRCGHSYKTNEDRCNHCGRREIEETHVERNRIVHPIRSYGLLHNFNPKEELVKHFGREKGLEVYHRLAHEIANLLILREEKDEKITMEWNEEEEELTYPASTEEFVTIDEDVSWISVWKVFDLLYDEDFREFLPQEDYDFLEDLADYLKVEGKPPPLRRCSHIPCAGMFFVPRSISVCAREQDTEFSLTDFKLRNKVLRLIDKGEGDIWRLDICLADYSLGYILKTIKRLVKMGVVVDGDRGLRLEYGDWTDVEITPDKSTPGEKWKATVVSEEVVRLVGGGVNNYDFLRSHFPSVPSYVFKMITDKLLEDGTIIRQLDGELILGR